MKDIEKVSLGKVKYDSLSGKSVIHATISQFDPDMNKILGINNENYIDTLLSKKIYSFKINNLSTTDNIFTISQVTYCIMGTLIKTYNLVKSFTLSQIILNIKTGKWSD